MKIIAIIQARMGSSRLPGKTLADVCGHPAIWHLFCQMSFSKRLDECVLATTTNPLDDPLVAYASGQGWKTHRGSETDVLDRYFQAAKRLGCAAADAVVRVTGDDILADPELIDQVIDLYSGNQPRVQYHVSNNRVATFPYGADVEAFSFLALEQAWREARLPEEREHVTPYIRNHPELFPFAEVRSERDDSHIRLSIDYPEDLDFARELVGRLCQTSRPPFRMSEIVDCINRHNIRHKKGNT